MAPTNANPQQLEEYRELLKTLKGDIRTREARYVLRTTRLFYARDLDPQDEEAENRILTSRTYRSLTEHLAEQHRVLEKELKKIRKSEVSSQKAPSDRDRDHESRYHSRTGSPIYSSRSGSPYGRKSRFEIIQERLKDNEERQDRAIDGLERFIEEEVEAAMKAEG